MIRRYVPRSAVTLAVIFLLNLSDLVQLRRLAVEYELSADNDADRIFAQLLFGFHRLDTGLNTANISQLAFLAVPPLFFGQSISADLSISGTYYFTRQDRRTRWYVKRSLSLLVISLVIAAFTCLLNTAMTSYFDAGSVAAERAGLVMLSMTSCIFLLVMLSNIAGIFFGSVTALAVTVVYAAANILLIYTPARRASIVLCCNFLPQDTFGEMAFKTGINTAYALAAFIAGLVVIRKKEIGLVNAEQLF